MTRAQFFRMGLLVSSALATSTLGAGAARAQSAAAESGGLEEIVVTAQKREQSLQDVPIAVTALTENTLQVNRVSSVSDLSGLAPGVIVRTAAGGSQLPSFSIRGAISYGVVPGSDKQVSIYVDGVYVGSGRGGIFDLPDVQRIEMLRGPQGTLFGRNATAGAVSISTRDPSGEVGVKASFTVGNYDQYRMRVSVDTPQVGPFSAYGTFVHNYKRGDIRNAGAGAVWDRRAAGLGVARSPQWLGTRKSDSYFAAVKFEPSDSFKTVYKFDYNREEGTPEGTGLVGINSAAPGIGALLGPLVNTLIASQATPVNIAADGKRPSVVNNSWVVPTDQKTYGHSLTSTLVLSDSLSVKNILAYRNSHIFAPSPIDGFSGLTFTQQSVVPLATFQAIAGGLPTSFIPVIAAGLQSRVGQPFVALGVEAESYSKQWSDEFQINYNSSLLTVTAGGIWFHSDERNGALRIPGTVSFSVVNGGVITGNQAVNYNKATSLAAFAQVEVHVTPELDLVGGARITYDHKTGQLITGPANALIAFAPFDYKKTKPNFLVGMNFKPSEEILLYGKFSTAFVSGGSVSGLVFQPETATSWEAGVKADLLGRRLRTNLSLFHVTYKNFQTAQSGSNFPGLFPSPPFPIGFASVVGTVIVPQGGPVKAQGFEFETTAAPFRGLTVGGSLSYTDTKFENVNPVLIAQSRGDYQPALRSKWTGGLWGQFETQPLVGETTLLLRADANWHSMFYLTQNPSENIPAFAGIRTVGASWTVNARAALRNIDIGGVKTEVAVWAKNLTQNREATFALTTLGVFGAANYVPARTIGADLTIQF
ncbi:TonB-dependent receptor [Novosphingobium sp. G106]|uniref:TonB-dependent receptor n=1 Tax=Novosphingobium sp. G106 TaxID=2849500 RepID=UPI001C2CF0EB|nr:TonB-dependent receptor [Novosphingobium sp. G106]MBV1690396.1 TonB-dependent receptor [Novosphingobium sp. G106]